MQVTDEMVRVAQLAANLDRACVPVRFRHSPRPPHRAPIPIYKTPHEIGVEVAHKQIAYGMYLERMQGGYILQELKKTIFRAVRDTITSAMIPPTPRIAISGKSDSEKV